MNPYALRFCLWTALMIVPGPRRAAEPGAGLPGRPKGVPATPRDRHMARTLDHRKPIGQNWPPGTGPRPALR